MPRCRIMSWKSEPVPLKSSRAVWSVRPPIGSLITSHAVPGTGGTETDASVTNPITVPFASFVVQLTVRAPEPGNDGTPTAVIV